MEIVREAKQIKLDIPSFTKYLYPYISNIVRRYLTKPYLKDWKVRRNQAEHTNEIINVLVNSFHEDLKGTYVKTNDEDSVLIDMTCMTRLKEHAKNHNKFLPTHTEAHDDATPIAPDTDTNPYAHLPDRRKYQLDITYKVPLPNTSLGPHFNLP